MSQTLFSRLGAVMDEMRRLQEDEARSIMSVQALEVFFVVAGKEGISSAEIRRRTDIAQPTVSRALGDLGDWAAKRNAEGLKLIRTERDPEDQRNILCFLTPKGKLLAARIAQLMGAGGGKVDAPVDGAQ